MEAMSVQSSQPGRQLDRAVQEFNDVFHTLEGQIGQVIVGMEDVVRNTLSTIFAGGHVLLEGVPGLGKTLLVKSIATAFGLTAKRIQFTPDLMPSDVTGTQVLTEDESGKRRFVFKPGPIFANIVLADEINRATPKTQAALLEAMEEKQITVLDETHFLQQPFFVLATQNPIELEGTYPLPEAQLDRFLMKLKVTPPTSSQLKEVLLRTTGTFHATITPAFRPEDVHERVETLKQLVRQVMVADPILEILVRMMSSLTPGSEHATERVNRYVRFGPGPRAAQAVMMSSKVQALLDSRINLSFDDLRNMIGPCLRHRLVLNFQAEADGVSSDELIHEVSSVQ
jgi:MoxR-like ATPase